MSSGFVEQVRGTRKVSGIRQKTQNNKQTLLCKKDLYFIYPQLRVVVCEPHSPHDSLVNFMFPEDLVLAEDRTTEVDRELIMEGGTGDLSNCCGALLRFKIVLAAIIM